MEVDSRLTYVVPRGTVVFRVETYSVVQPPYLFYAYFGGNLKQQFMTHKRAWVSRCAGSEDDPDRRVRVIFMRLTRDVELLEMSMNSYNYDEPTTEELQALGYLEEMARSRLGGAPQELACVIDALHRLYNAPQDESDGSSMVPDCPSHIDYTAASFVHSHLKVDGWIRLDNGGGGEDGGSVMLDEVMLVRRVLDNGMELIGEYPCSLLDIDAPPPTFMTDDYVQPSIYRRMPIARRTRSTNKGTKSLIEQIHLHNDNMREMTLNHAAECLQCEHPCSSYENGEPERPFCSIGCQMQTGLYDIK